PIPAATSAAAVLILKVVRLPPPVPQVSTSDSGLRASMASMARRSAPAAPATSSGVSPFTRNPIRSADTCAGVASPLMMVSNAEPANSLLNDLPAASSLIALPSASLCMNSVQQSLGQARLRRYQSDHSRKQAHAFHIRLVEHSLPRTIRQVHHADNLVVVDEREADE